MIWVKFFEQEKYFITIRRLDVEADNYPQDEK